MNAWSPYPLLRLLVPFLAGIAAGISVSSFTFMPVPAIVILVFLLAGTRLVPLLVPGYGCRWITGLFINGFLLVAGFDLVALHRPCNDPAYPGPRADGLFVAVVDEAPTYSKGPVKITLDVRYRMERDHWVRTSLHALAYLQSRPGAWSLQYGDQLLVRTVFSEITDNSNPHTFSYPAYLKNKGVTHRGYAGMHAWTMLHARPAGLVKRVAFRFRDRLMNLMRENHVEGREFAVASALLLGYVGDIDAGLRRDYSASGAMHILSVSGMHVGIIYVFLEFLLGFLNKSKPGRFCKAVILFIFIWFYALLTGMSPCVLRSAAMLSLPILGKAMNRSTGMFNILAASVIILLAMDPFLMVDVSFQLSYLAVTGIVILYKPVYDLYVTSAWLPDKIWSIMAMSIAAQLATLPVTLYTFHQFPNYFMLTNIFVVPLSSLVIYTGIATLAVGTVPVVSLLAAKALIFLVWLLNWIIHFVEELPCSTIRGIFISGPEMYLLYLVIGAGFLFLTRRQTVFLWLFLAGTIAFNLLVIDFKLDRLHASGFTVFNSGHSGLMEVSCQDRAMVFYQGIAPGDSLAQKMNQDILSADLNARGICYCRSYWSGRPHPGGPGPFFMPCSQPGNFIQAGTHRIGVLNKSVPKGFRGSIRVEYLVLSMNPAVKIADICRIYHPRLIIIDATNTRFRTQKWLQEAGVLKVSCHAVSIGGAFEKEF